MKKLTIKCEHCSKQTSIGMPKLVEKDKMYTIKEVVDQGLLMCKERKLNEMIANKEIYTLKIKKLGGGKGRPSFTVIPAAAITQYWDKQYQLIKN